ncbi:hypothetical protein OBBRIDRAFT_879713 [Obba rivulosa]|uniref:Uncharacterized protein n=1 Tax=Obba rivulosa TaxID=1052685 RepID=A0A8E2AS34_9APHY|nr:hypothetical protein OBBRIDRAFT_879713 [Obba rivulosa]
MFLSEQDAHGFDEVYDGSERISTKHNMCKYPTCFIRPGTLAVVEFKLIKYWSKKYSTYGTQLQLGAIYYLNDADPEVVRLAEERQRQMPQTLILLSSFVASVTVKKGCEVGSMARVSLPSLKILFFTGVSLQHHSNAAHARQGPLR